MLIIKNSFFLMILANQDKNLNEAVYVSLCANALEKGMNLSIIFSAMSK